MKKQKRRDKPRLFCLNIISLINDWGYLNKRMINNSHAIFQITTTKIYFKAFSASVAALRVGSMAI